MHCFECMIPPPRFPGMCLTLEIAGCNVAVCERLVPFGLSFLEEPLPVSSTTKQPTTPLKCNPTTFE